MSLTRRGGAEPIPQRRREPVALAMSVLMFAFSASSLTLALTVIEDRDRSNLYSGFLLAALSAAASVYFLIASRAMPRWHDGSPAQRERWNAYPVSDQSPLGVIKNISTLVAMLDVYVFSDALVVVRGSPGAALMVAKGALASARAFDDERLGANLKMSPCELCDVHPEASIVPVAAVRQAELKKIVFGLGARLVLRFDDGSSAKFEWKGMYNDYDQVMDLLRVALGPRLLRV